MKGWLLSFSTGLRYAGYYLAILCYLLWPVAYFLYVEVDKVQHLVFQMPMDARAYILSTYASMIASWGIFCISPLMLLDKLDVKKRTLFIAITVSAGLMLAAVITLTSLLYAHAYQGMTSRLVLSIREANSSTSIKEAWNITQTKMQCCGVNGPSDWIAANYTIAPCGGYTFPCMQAVTVSYTIMLGMGVLGLASAVFIAAKGYYNIQVVEYIEKKVAKAKHHML